MPSRGSPAPGTGGPVRPRWGAAGAVGTVVTVPPAPVWTNGPFGGGPLARRPRTVAVTLAHAGLP